jgi:hypothetical protein
LHGIALGGHPVPAAIALHNMEIANSDDGARRIRTADLLGAIQALCQLSYSPISGDLQEKRNRRIAETSRSLQRIGFDSGRLRLDLPLTTRRGVARRAAVSHLGGSGASRP